MSALALHLYFKCSAYQDTHSNNILHPYHYLYAYFNLKRYSVPTYKLTTYTIFKLESDKICRKTCCHISWRFKHCYAVLSNTFVFKKIYTIPVTNQCNKLMFIQFLWSPLFFMKFKVASASSLLIQIYKYLGKVSLKTTLINITKHSSNIKKKILWRLIELNY